MMVKLHKKYEFSCSFLFETETLNLNFQEFGEKKKFFSLLSLLLTI